MQIDEYIAALSPYNENALGDAAVSMVSVADCTLRDGEQQAGLVLSRDVKIKIADLLIELGVDEIEAGTPMVSVDDYEAISEVAQSNRVKVSALARARATDIDTVAKTGSWGVRISLPASPLQLKYKTKMTEDDFIDAALSSTALAKDLGLYVIFSPFDTTRADWTFLERILHSLNRAGTVDRLRVVDTAGSATPAGIKSLVRLIQTRTDIPLEIHCHDDFGLATANTVAAVLSGAKHVSTSVNSLGERSGNASTEQVVAALEILYGVDTGVNMSNLTRVSNSVSWLSRTSLPPNTPVVGANSFAHESGLVTAGILGEPFTAEPYLPELVGQARRIVHGKKSGREAIAVALDELSLDSSSANVAAVLATVKDCARRLERGLTDDEFTRIATAAKTN